MVTTKTLETSAQMEKRGIGLVESAIKLDAEAHEAVRKALAVSLIYMGRFGNPKLLNLLFAGVKASTADGIRRWGINAIFDWLNVEGVRDATDSDKWAKRPFRPFQFQSKPDMSAKPPAFFKVFNRDMMAKLVNRAKTDKNATIPGNPGHDPKRIKQLTATTLEKLGAADEAELAAIDWTTLEVVAREVILTSTTMERDSVKFLKRYAAVGLLARNAIESAGRAFGLKADVIADIVETIPASMPEESSDESDDSKRKSRTNRQTGETVRANA